MSEKHLIVTPDAQYDDDGLLERQTAGDALEFAIWRSGEAPDAAALERATGLLVWHEQAVTGDFLDAMPNCRIVVRSGVGYDNIDLRAAGLRGIPVCNTPDYGTAEVADHAIAMLLSLERNLLALNARLVADPAAGFSYKAVPLPRRLAGRRIGIVGLGRIGTATALRAKAFGMQVGVHDPHIPDGQEIAVGVARFGELLELARWADVLSLHAPLNPETARMIGRDVLEALGPEGILVNTARGGLVDLDALAEALVEDRLRAAALDVFPQEPPPPEARLLSALGDMGSLRDRVILTPHSAWSSIESCADARTKSVRIIRDFLLDGRLRNCVNAELLVGDERPRATA